MTVRILLPLIILVFLITFLFSFSSVKAAQQREPGYPRLANYYLGRLESSSSFLDQIARYDVLILTPAQIKTHQSVMEAIKKRHPSLIILAYVPSQSYNRRYWPNDLVFHKFSGFQNDWWLRDSGGERIIYLQDFEMFNLDPAWRAHFLNFVSAEILSLPLVDGVFFDMVSENISWLNGGDIDLNSDGQKDNPSLADALWLERTTALLREARERFPRSVIVINGSSQPALQPYVNGRMFETFPTPWEGDGSWGAVMNRLATGASLNLQPHFTIVNSNTGNSGRRTDYRQMRFGLASALLENGYYSFDHGDQDHAQLWWYDEYNVDLGQPNGAAVSKQGFTDYASDVWRRDFAHGVALVNSAAEEQTVELGGEFEKIHGEQDKAVNDGSIISETVIDGFDGLILLKTLATLEDVLYTNGHFVRFFRPAGERARNGFFVFEEKYKGGDQIARIDLDGNGKRDLVVVRKNKLMAWRNDGQRYMRVYPYTASYAGELHVAIGDVNGDKKMEIIVSPSYGYPAPVKVYSRFGEIIRDDWFPLGEKYSGGLSVAIGNVNGGKRSEVIIGAGRGVLPSVYVYDADLALQKQWLAFESDWRGGVNVAAGDIDGNGKAEVIVGAGFGKPPIIKIFDRRGELLFPAWQAYQALNNPGIQVRALDVDFDGQDEVIGMSEGVGL